MRRPLKPFAGYMGDGGLRSYIVRATAGAGGAQIAGLFATFLIGIQLARGLGAASYGQYGMAIAVITIATLPGEFGVPKVVLREAAAAYSDGSFERVRAVVRWADRTCLLLAIPIGIAVGAFSLLSLTSREVAASIVLGTGLIVAVPLLRIRSAALQGLHYVASSQLPYFVARPLLFSAMLFIFFKLLDKTSASLAVGLNVISAVAALALSALLLRPRLKVSGPLAPLGETKALWKAALPMALTEGMRVAQLQLSVLLVGVLVGPAETGIYRAAASIVTLLATPLTILNSAASPAIARLVADKDLRVLQRLCWAVAVAMIIGLLLLIAPFILFGRVIVVALLGPDFTAAFIPIMVMSVGQLVGAAFGPNSILLNMSHNERDLTTAMLFSSITTIAFVLILTPLHGSTGAAWATVLGMLVWNVVAWLDCKRRFDIDTSVFGRRWRRV